MNDSKRVWAWVGVAVVIIVAVGWVVWAINSKPAVSGHVPVYAPQGQVVSQFPKNLILDSNAVVSGSYSISYSTSTNQYTVEYDSSSSMASVYAQYQNYLPRNGWAIIGSLTTQPTLEAITAVQGNNQLQVVIGTEGSGSQVTITYLTEGATSSQNSTSSDEWINVSNGVPPGFPSVPIPTLSTSTSPSVSILSDRYYVDADGVIHGEYSFTEATATANVSNMMALYGQYMPSSLWTITHPSVNEISAVQKNGSMQVDITINSSPASAGITVDITYANGNQ